MKRSANRPAPKQLRAIQTSRHLRTVPRQHTGHVLAKRHTSYPVLAMILLCVGVLLAGWTRLVTADGPTYGPAQGSYTVHVSVPGPAPSEPATINTTTMTPNAPNALFSGKVFSAIPISVSGSCPVNTYETLYRNSIFSGVALCSAVGDYTLQTDLFVGDNTLQTRDFSPTDVPGPLSNSVTVTYKPPASSSPSGGNSGSVSPSSSSGTSATSSASQSQVVTEPLLLKTNFTYQGYFTGQTSQWNLDIEGGTPPYAIAADWGDGQTSLISRPHAGSFSMTHAYQKAGAYKGSYPVIFHASDATNNETFLQLLTIINNPPRHVASSILKQSNSGGGNLSSLPDSVRRVADYLWPSYGVVVLLLASFWLGERREFHHLKPHFKQRRGTRHA